MRLVDSFKLSVNSILHRKLRSWLTLLGIVIGVAAVVSIVSIGEGAQASITDQLSDFGADTITITPGFSAAKSFGGIMRGGGKNTVTREGITSSEDDEDPTLTKLDVRVISANPNVKNVNEQVSGYGELVFMAEKTNVSIKGVNPNVWNEVTTLELASGRFLNSSDSKVVVLDHRTASEVFNQPITIGRRITIENQSFTVVGILTDTGGGGFMSGGSTVYLPYKSAWTVTDTEIDTFSSLEVQVFDPEIVEETVQELTASLLVSRKVTADKQNFTVTSFLSIMEQITDITQTLTLFLGAIAAVSLVVGGVGVANSMFTSVLEKTKLIGILKALGATNYEIMLLFIIESGLFGLTGGFIGVLLGSFVSSLLGTMGGASMPMMKGGMNTLVSMDLMLLAIGIATLIGILSGLLPARAASKLKPIEALRYE